VVEDVIEREAMICADMVSSNEVDSDNDFSEETAEVMKSLTEGESAVVLATES